MKIKELLLFVIRNLIKFSIYISLLCVLLVAGILLYWNWCAYKPLMTKKFDKLEWRLAQEEFKIERRCGMYHDLTRNHMHKGMSIKEVEELLGPIDRLDYCEDKEIKCAMYYMGICYSNALSVVPMAVEACFNKKGRLVTYDREVHCKLKGGYYLKTEEQTCLKKAPDGTGRPSSDCGLTPW